MRTQLNEFCAALSVELDALAAAALDAAEALTRVTHPAPASAVSRLQTVADGLTQLSGRLEAQRAYVIIFGPLKSGKSTLMNAICARYVSEVSSLPAYPCLVQVQDAPGTSYRIVRYDGDSQPIEDVERMRDLLRADHVALAETIVRCEQEGVSFQPDRHAPRAIRTIDVRTPAGSLAGSGAVLVDTPGLYARMKFDYDRLTRDFRDRAACAVFVVKTDTLFLEQVFAEFEELLALFDRVFLIVNLDANKQDLQPDGTLAPSLDHADPTSLVAAFEDLAMSAELKAAHGEGRLSIYPVDVLGAAARRIQAGRGDPSPVPAEATLEGEADFERLLDDLTDYLDGTTHAARFLKDSQDRAGQLIAELDEIGRDPGVTDLEDAAAQREQRQRELDERSASLRRLSALDWPNELTALREAIQSAAQQRIDALLARSRVAVDRAVGEWFADDSTLDELLRSRVAPAFNQFWREAGSSVEHVLDRQRAAFGESAKLSEALRRDLQHARIDIAELATHVPGKEQPAKRPDAPAPELSPDDVPIQLRFRDRLLLRSPAKLRKRLFGTPDAQAESMPADGKKRWLGEYARQVMAQKLFDQLDSTAERAAQSFLPGAVARYLEGLEGDLRAKFAEESMQIQDERARNAAELATAKGALEELHALSAVRARATKSLATVSARFAGNSS